MKQISYDNWKMTYDKWHPDANGRGKGGFQNCGYCTTYDSCCGNCVLSSRVCGGIGSAFEKWQEADDRGRRNKTYADRIFHAIVAHGKTLGYLADYIAL